MPRAYETTKSRNSAGNIKILRHHYLSKSCCLLQFESFKNSEKRVRSTIFCSFVLVCTIFVTSLPNCYLSINFQVLWAGVPIKMKWMVDSAVEVVQTEPEGVEVEAVVTLAGPVAADPILVGEVVDLSMEARSRPTRVESIMATDTSSLSFLMSNRLL